MFTGLVQAVGTVDRVEPVSAGSRLRIDARSWPHRPTLGDSIAVNGCCLTVAADPASLDRKLAFDAVPETLRLTTLALLKPGDAVNLEHAVTAATLMGGHFVQGHVDGVGVVERVVAAGERRITVRPPPPLMEFLTPKGSVCVDGVSLTVAGLDPAGGTFDVALIPTTLGKTTLARLAVGSRVNLEMDTIAKTVVHWMKHYGRT